MCELGNLELMYFISDHQLQKHQVQPTWEFQKLRRVSQNDYDQLIYKYVWYELFSSKNGGITLMILGSDVKMNL